MLLCTEIWGSDIKHLLWPFDYSILSEYFFFYLSKAFVSLFKIPTQVSCLSVTMIIRSFKNTWAALTLLTPVRLHSSSFTTTRTTHSPLTSHSMWMMSWAPTTDLWPPWPWWYQFFRWRGWRSLRSPPDTVWDNRPGHRSWPGRCLCSCTRCFHTAFCQTPCRRRAPYNGQITQTRQSEGESESYSISVYSGAWYYGRIVVL